MVGNINESHSTKMLHHLPGYFFYCRIITVRYLFMFEAQRFEVHNRKIIVGAHRVRCSARNLKHCCETEVEDRCLLNPFWHYRLKLQADPLGHWIEKPAGKPGEMWREAR